MTPLQEWLRYRNRKLTQDAIDEALLEYIALIEKEREEAYEAGRAAAMEGFEFIGCAGILDDYFLSKSGLEAETKLYRLKGEKR